MDFSLLCKIFRVSNSQLLKVQQRFTGLQAFLEAPLSDIEPLVGPQSYKAICTWRNSGRLPRDYIRYKQFIDQQAIKTLCLGSEDYPQLLAEISAPPVVLFIKGSLEKLALPQIAVVGSRRSTAQGVRLAFSFAKELGEAGFGITSGLALGIDGAAHNGAIAAGAQTLAVMGTGIDQVYPARHKPLAEQILATGGALISEFMLGSPPKPEHFPRRNRIVTGLSLGVLVVEAGLKSGSLISARLAAEQGRAVCALPGSIRSPVAAGCNQLIREGATLVTSPEQVVEQLAPLLGFQHDICQERFSAGETQPVSEQQASHSWLLNIMGFDPYTVDQLCDLSGRTASEVTAVLAELELAGDVAQTPYGYQCIN